MIKCLEDFGSILMKYLYYYGIFSFYKLKSLPPRGNFKLGEDADTIGVTYGQIVGICLSITKKWLNIKYLKKEIKKMVSYLVVYGC